MKKSSAQAYQSDALTQSTLLSLKTLGESKIGAKASFASLKKQAETLFRLICCERKTLFRLKK